ncbi:MAG: hypothetical protein O2887_04395 [Bacteroidetes bacterium]|nr:hypothetical protein [Bacteroidota bacterium]MDA1119725.1 hypothetical protein [Bacteroidota bacterium]
MSVILFITFKRPLAGVLVVAFAAFLKEFIDLGIVYYYEPIQLKFWMDSFFDVLTGFLGIGAGFLVQPYFIRLKFWTPTK